MLHVIYNYYLITLFLFQVIDDSGPSNNRGMHVVVLNQHTGMVMAQRVFDTYMDDEPLIGFLKRVSTGRIMIFAIKVSIMISNKCCSKHLHFLNEHNVDDQLLIIFVLCMLYKEI